MLSAILTILVMIFSGITTIPLSIGVISVFTVVYKKTWVFFLAFAMGLYLDFILVEPPGLSSLLFTVFVFLIRLYERKFETQTTAFVFISTFLGSLLYLWLFRYQMVFLQAIVNALTAIFIFRICHSELVSESPASRRVFNDREMLK